MITTAQILHELIELKKLKHATNLLGYHDAKNTMEHEPISENVSKKLYPFSKSRKYNIWAIHYAITPFFVELLSNMGSGPLSRSHIKSHQHEKYESYKVATANRH